jgi:VIT1/CCC1 family predicted Fe2+/Mn2+ transporter
MQAGDHPEQPVEGVRIHEIGSRTYVVADVEPLDVDGTRTVAVGSGLFLLAFLVLLPFYGRLEDAGKAWWAWTCLAGLALGVVGWGYCRLRRARRQRRPVDQPRREP